MKNKPRQVRRLAEVERKELQHNILKREKSKVAYLRGFAIQNMILFYDDYMVIIPSNYTSYPGKFILIDIKDYDLVKPYTWYVRRMRKSNLFYAQANYRRLNRKTVMSMHKLIYPQYKLTDHIDRNGLNNRRGNLRECTYEENARNSETYLKKRGLL